MGCFAAADLYHDDRLFTTTAGLAHVFRGADGIALHTLDDIEALCREMSPGRFTHPLGGDVGAWAPAVNMPRTRVRQALTAI